MPDQMLTCVMCQQSFIFTPGEQVFYASRRFAAPRRCLKCRALQREKKQAALAAIVESKSESTY
jgi:hypothetical protein